MNHISPHSLINSFLALLFTFFFTPSATTYIPKLKKNILSNKLKKKTSQQNDTKNVDKKKNIFLQKNNKIENISDKINNEIIQKQNSTNIIRQFSYDKTLNYNQRSRSCLTLFKIKLPNNSLSKREKSFSCVANITYMADAYNFHPLANLCASGFYSFKIALIVRDTYLFYTFLSGNYSGYCDFYQTSNVKIMRPATPKYNSTTREIAIRIKNSKGIDQCDKTKFKPFGALKNQVALLELFVNYSSDEFSVY